MATKITVEDVLRRMCKHKLIDMSAVSDFDITYLSRLRSGIYSRKRLTQYINLINFLYHDTETENNF